MTKKIGLLGGTFDPIHFGHLHLGISLQEAHGLDEVIVCPAFQSPLKHEHPTQAQDRLAMVEIAVREIPTWRPLDWEVSRKQLSYTIETIEYCLKNVLTKDGQLFLLLGEDLLAEFSRWKDVEKILTLAAPLIGCRKPTKAQEKYALSSKLAAGMTSTNLLEISATEIRQRLKKKLYCGHLVPAKVLDYITLHRLYSSI